MPAHRERGAIGPCKTSHARAGNITDLAEGYKKNTKGFKELSSSSLAPLGGTQYRSVMPGTLIGSYKTLARKVAEHVKAADLDGVLLIVPDYISHLEQVGIRTFPQLSEYGIECNVGANL